MSNINEIVKEIEKELNIKFELTDRLIGLTENFAQELKNKGITQSSIRNIYDSFKSIQLRLQKKYVMALTGYEKQNAEDISFKDVYPQIRLMKSKCNYIIERKIEENEEKPSKNKNNKINSNDVEKNNKMVAYEALKEFIFIFNNHIKSKKQFDDFIDLFECVIGNLKG